MKRTIHTLCLLAALAAALATALTIPASAEKRNVAVRMTDGTVQYFVVDAPPRARRCRTSARWCPGEPIGFADVPPGRSPPAPTTPAPTPPPPPESDFGELQDDNAPAKPGKIRTSRTATGPSPSLSLRLRLSPSKSLRLQYRSEGKPKRKPRSPPPRRDRHDPRPAAPTAPPLPGNPGFVDALPGPSTARACPTS